MSDRDFEPHIPSRLHEALERAYDATPPEAELDFDAMPKRISPLRLRLQRYGPMAAALLLSAALAISFMRSNQPDPLDLNADGRVDVLDALALANAIDASLPGPDLNQDGRSDRLDVDTVMHTIVRLDGSAG